MYKIINYCLLALILFYIISRFNENDLPFKNRVVYIFEALIVITMIVEVNFAHHFDINVFDEAEFNRQIYTILSILLVICFGKYIYKLKSYKLLMIGLAYFLTFEIAFKISHNFYLDLINYFYILSSLANMIINLIANFLNLMIWFIIIKVIKERQYYHSLISYLPLLLASITIIIILKMMNMPASHLSKLSLVIIIILINYLIIYIYMNNMHRLQKQLSEKKFEIERNYYKEKIELDLNNYNRSFNFMHDLIYKLKDIKNHIDDKDLALIDSEVSDLQKELIKEFNILYTNSKTISLVLNNHLSEIAKHNIKIKTTIKYSDFTFLDEVDAISLFDKLIKYAIQEASSVKENYKFINLSTENKNSSIIIKLIFSKRSDEFNDVLLDEIEDILKQYKGRCLKEYDDIDKYALINISFNITDINDYFAIENQNN